MKLEPNGDFVVGEEKILNAILSFVFFGLFVYGVSDAILKKHYEPGLMPVFFAGSLALSYWFFKKSRSKKIYLRINQHGIFKEEKLVTDWDHLIKAYITQKKTGGLRITDGFVLILEYLRSETDTGYRTIIPLTNTQNRSEEEIMEALRHFNP